MNEANNNRNVTLHLADGTELSASINMLTLKLITSRSLDGKGREIPGTSISDMLAKQKKLSGKIQEPATELSLSLVGKLMHAVLNSNGRHVETEDEALALTNPDDDGLVTLLETFSNRMDSEKKSGGLPLSRKTRRMKGKKPKK